MTNSAKYIVYKCNVCYRETELALDGRRPDPSRCNITLKCRGKLERIGARSGKEFLFTPLVPGLPDYIQRGTSIVAAPKLSVPNPITVYTAAGAGIIAIAGIRRTVVGANTEFSVIDENNNPFVVETFNSIRILPTSPIRAVLFEISPELLSASRYIYSIVGPVSIVTGLDNSPDSKKLRFTEANEISVFVNGIEIDESEYDRSVDDQIIFTPTIIDSNNVVEVFVYNDITTTISTAKQVVLEFRTLIPTVLEDLDLRKLCCWGNYGGTMIGDEVERMTLFCTDLTGLNQDKSYGIAYFEITSTEEETRKILPSEIFFLLGKEPFAYRDKELYAYLEGNKLVNEQSILTYKISQLSGQLFLTVDASSITQVFNPIKLTKRITLLIRYEPPTTGTALEGTENLKPKYILGPV